MAVSSQSRLRKESRRPEACHETPATHRHYSPPGAKTARQEPLLHQLGDPPLKHCTGLDLKATDTRCAAQNALMSSQSVNKAPVLAISPNDEMLALTDDMERVHIWDLQQMRGAGNRKPKHVVPGGSATCAVQFSCRAHFARRIAHKQNWARAFRVGAVT
jgi:hypothetical protein